MTCHNCGCPQGALIQDGRSVQIQLAAGYGEKRPRKSTVWVCSDFCAIQALGISKHGAKTSSWPITLAQWTPIAKRILRDLK
jgi:hypothetical protein